MYDFAISNIQGYMRNSTAIKDKISDFHLAQISLHGMHRTELLPLAEAHSQKIANTDITKPEQSAPFVRLVPPHTYGLPTNCTAKSATAWRFATRFLFFSA